MQNQTEANTLQQKLISSIQKHPIFINYSKEELIKSFIKTYSLVDFEETMIEIEIKKRNPNYIDFSIPRLTDIWDLFITNILIINNDNKTTKQNITNKELRDFFNDIYLYDLAFQAIGFSKLGGTHLNKINDSSYNFSINNKIDINKILYTRHLAFEKTILEENENIYGIDERFINIGDGKNIFYIIKFFFEYSISNYGSNYENLLKNNFNTINISKKQLISLIKNYLYTNGVYDISKEKIINILNKLSYNINKLYEYEKIYPKTKFLIFNNDYYIIPIPFIMFLRFERTYFTLLNNEYYEEIFNQTKFQDAFRDYAIDMILNELNNNNKIIVKTNLDIQVKGKKTDIDLLIYHKKTNKILAFECKNFITPDKWHDEHKLYSGDNSVFIKSKKQISIIKEYLENSYGIYEILGIDKNLKIENNVFLLTSNNYIGLDNINFENPTSLKHIINIIKNNGVDYLFDNINILNDYKLYNTNNIPSYYDPNKQNEKIKIPIYNNNKNYIDIDILKFQPKNNNN